MVTKLQLNCVMIEDEKVGGYTAFFAEFPEIVVMGETEEEVELNLLQTVSAVFRQRMSEIETEQNLQNFKTKPLNFELEVA